MGLFIRDKAGLVLSKSIFLGFEGRVLTFESEEPEKQEKVVRLYMS